MKVFDCLKEREENSREDQLSRPLDLVVRGGDEVPDAVFRTFEDTNVGESLTALPSVSKQLWHSWKIGSILQFHEPIDFMRESTLVIH